MYKTIPDSYLLNPPKWYSMRVYKDIGIASFTSRYWQTAYYSRSQPGQLEREDNPLPKLIQWLKNRWCQVKK